MYCYNCGNECSEAAIFCKNCGTRIKNEATPENGKSCPACGASVKADEDFCMHCGAALGAQPKKTYGIRPRSIAKAIILSLITCGIYEIVWFVRMTNEMNKLSDSRNEASGGAAFWLNFVTCGIYGHFWAYRMGKKQGKLAGATDFSVLYLILSLVGVGFVNYIIIQDALNRFLEER